MENNNMGCGSGSCGKCESGSGCGRHHSLLRWLIGLVILVMIFGIGVKFGEWKGYIHSDFRQWRMMGGNGGGYDQPWKDGGPVRMMPTPEVIE